MRRSSRIRYSKTAGKENLRRLYWMLGGLTLITVFLVFFVIGDYGLYQIYLLHKRRKQVGVHIEQLRAEQDSLLAQRKRLENDLEYIEKLARERYRMAKRGEQVFRVIEQPEKK